MSEYIPDTLREDAIGGNGGDADGIEGMSFVPLDVLLAHADAWEADRKRLEAMRKWMYADEAFDMRGITPPQEHFNERAALAAGEDK